MQFLNWRWTPLQWGTLGGACVVLVLLVYGGVSHTVHVWNQISAERELREQFRNQTDGIETMVQQVDSLRKYRDRLEQHRPGIRSQPQILSQIHRIASRVNIRQIQSLAPERQYQSEDIQVHTFTVRVRDDYSTLLRFLNRLEQATPPFYIESMELRVTKNSEQQALDAEITASQAGELGTS